MYQEEAFFYRTIVTPFGALIVEVIFPFDNRRCKMVTTPFGVGNLPSANDKSPKLGCICNRVQPGESTCTPNTCSVSQAVGPEAQP